MWALYMNHADMIVEKKKNIMSVPYDDVFQNMILGLQYTMEVIEYQSYYRLVPC